MVAAVIALDQKDGAIAAVVSYARQGRYKGGCPVDAFRAD